jgi:tRNA uridine 5-carboxymethylaminomethyl modification enzyme
VKKREPFTLSRSESYIGVMIDDLINKGTEEPYRIFTSRAEYRLLLRQDNADSRLMRKGYGLGLIDSVTIARLEEKERTALSSIQYLRTESSSPAEVNDLLVQKGSEPITENVPLAKLLRRPEISITDLLNLERVRRDGKMARLVNERSTRERVEIEIKYEGYLRRQEEDVRRFQRYESISIPTSFNFSAVRSLSKEGKERLEKVKPQSIGQASRISGVTPADISVVMVNLRKISST